MSVTFRVRIDPETRSHAHNADLLSVVRFLVDRAPELIPPAVECLQRNLCRSEYEDTGRYLADDLPGVAPDLVVQYNEKMERFYCQIPDRQEKKAGLLRGLAFEALVCEAFRACRRQPAWEVHRDCQVCIDEEVVVVSNEWGTGDRDRAASCDVAVWPSDQNHAAAWFVSCKLSAKGFLELDLAYLYRVRSLMAHAPSVGLAAGAWPQRVVELVMDRWYSVVPPECHHREVVPQTMAGKSIAALCRADRRATTPSSVLPGHSG